MSVGDYAAMLSAVSGEVKNGMDRRTAHLTAAIAGSKIESIKNKDFGADGDRGRCGRFARNKRGGMRRAGVEGYRSA